MESEVPEEAITEVAESAFLQKVETDTCEGVESDVSKWEGPHGEGWSLSR